MKIIVLEGLDASGKDTIADKLYERIVKTSSFDDVRLYRDPGSTPLGEELRRILLHGSYPLCSSEQTLLFQAARLALMRQIMSDDRRLDRKWVILNRWYFSTIVYQCEQGQSRFVVDTLNKMFSPLPLNPKLCFLLDIPVEVAQQRMERAGREPDRFEGAGRAKFEDRRKRYLTLVQEGLLTRVDAKRSIDTIVHDIYEAALRVRD